MTVPVADSDVPDQPLLHKRLHGPPGVLDRDVRELHLLVLAFGVMEPLRWISLLERDKLEADGEVDEVKVEILEAEGI